MLMPDDDEVPCTCGHDEGEHGSEQNPFACRECGCEGYVPDPEFAEFD